MIDLLGLLGIIMQETSKLDEQQLIDIGVYQAMFKAVEYENIGLIDRCIRLNPKLLWCYDENRRNIFLYATRLRKAKIFNLLYQMNAVKKNRLTTRLDKFQNSILHQAAMLAPDNELRRISGGALQMQRELQWFKVIPSFCV